MKRILLYLTNFFCVLSVAAEEDVRILYDFEKDGVYYNIHTEDYIFERPWNYGDPLEIIETEPYVTVVSKESASLPYEYYMMDCLPYLTNEGNSYSGDVVIPAEVEFEGVIYPVKKIDYGAFEKCHNLKSVKLPESIESIEPYAFYNCPNLEMLNLPAKVKLFSMCDVFNCVKLRTLNLTNITGNTYFSFNCVEEGIAAEWTALEHLWLPMAAKSCVINNLASDAIFHITTNTPPVDYEFDESVFKRATLIVPLGAKEAYRNAPVWKNFKIIEEEETSISSTEAHAEVIEVRFSDLAGREVLRPLTGIYIRSTLYSNGKITNDKVRFLQLSTD